MSVMWDSRDGDPYVVRLSRARSHGISYSSHWGLIGKPQILASSWRHRLFWLVFATVTWTLQMIRNKMVIERVLL